MSEGRRVMKWQSPEEDIPPSPFPSMLQAMSPIPPMSARGLETPASSVRLPQRESNIAVVSNTRKRSAREADDDAELQNLLRAGIESVERPSRDSFSLASMPQPTALNLSNRPSKQPPQESDVFVRFHDILTHMRTKLDVLSQDASATHHEKVDILRWAMAEFASSLRSTSLLQESGDDATSEMQTWMIAQEMLFFDLEHRLLQESDMQNGETAEIMDDASRIQSGKARDIEMHRMFVARRAVERVFRETFPLSGSKDSVTYDATVASIVNNSRAKNTVSSVDMDARFRESLKMQSEDEEKDRLFMTELWSYLKGGAWIEAINMCMERKQHVRALHIQGATISSRCGSLSRKMWKRVVQHMASDIARVSEHERRVAALLAGDMDSLISAVRQEGGGWLDRLWAVFVSSTESWTDAQLCGTSCSFVSSVPRAADIALDVESSQSSRSSMSFWTHVQHALLSGNFDVLRKLLVQHSVEVQTSVSDTNRLRFSVTLLVVVECLNASVIGEAPLVDHESWTAQLGSVAGAYSSILKSMDHTDLIAHYVRYEAVLECVARISDVLVHAPSLDNRLALLASAEKQLHRDVLVSICRAACDVCLDNPDLPGALGLFDEALMNMAFQGSSTVPTRAQRVIASLTWVTKEWVPAKAEQNRLDDSHALVAACKRMRFFAMQPDPCWDGIAYLGSADGSRVMPPLLVQHVSDMRAQGEDVNFGLLDEWQDWVRFAECLRLVAQLQSGGRVSDNLWRVCTDVFPSNPSGDRLWLARLADEDLSAQSLCRRICLSYIAVSLVEAFFAAQQHNRLQSLFVAIVRLDQVMRAVTNETVFSKSIKESLLRVAAESRLLSLSEP